MLRKDYILDRWIYYSPSRRKRPNEFKNNPAVMEAKSCLFCQSNEKLTPLEIGRLEYKGDWKIRWFLNKFPVVDVKKKPKLKKSRFLVEGSSYGVHEVVVETNHHKSQLSDLPISQIRELLEVYRLRIKDLSKISGISYVQVFKNQGKDAGTSIMHSHSQITALSKVPSLVAEEVKAVRQHKKCPYCEIIKAEARSKRKIFETNNAIAFCPFASRFNYEAWIFPKQHKKTLEELNENEMEDIAAAIKKILAKLKKINASYNLYLHYSPDKENLHFHIEIAPRIANWGGFEFSTNFIINSVMPEDAARFYRK